MIKEILVMEVGAELDKEVAIALGYEVKSWWEFQGKPVYHYRVPSQYGEVWERLPHYSTDISAASDVIEKVAKAKPPVKFSIEMGWYPAPWAIAHFVLGIDDYEAAGKTIAEATCKAALLAIHSQNNEGRLNATS